jgi:hypothetical protein
MVSLPHDEISSSGNRAENVSIRSPKERLDNFLAGYGEFLATR